MTKRGLVFFLVFILFYFVLMVKKKDILRLKHYWIQSGQLSLLTFNIHFKYRHFTEIEPMDLCVLMECSTTDPHSWPFLKSYLYFDL